MPGHKRLIELQKFQPLFPSQRSIIPFVKRAAIRHGNTSGDPLMQPVA
jgi:hypothetical protein